MKITIGKNEPSDKPSFEKVYEFLNALNDKEQREFSGFMNGVLFFKRNEKADN